MTIYKLTISEVDSTPALISSNFKAERYPKSVEFYLDHDKAKNKQQEIYEGLAKLAGFIPNVEVKIESINVIE